jgi:hypothetical protein
LTLTVSRADLAQGAYTRRRPANEDSPAVDSPQELTIKQKSLPYDEEGFFYATNLTGF